MNGLDVLIVVIVLLQGARGAAAGFTRQACSLGGFVAGLVLGAAAAPPVIARVDGAATRPLVAAALVLGGAVVLGIAGGALGRRLGGLAARLRLRPFDAVLGAAFSAAVSLFSIWLIASIFSGTPQRELNRQVRDSRVLEAVDRRLPPAPAMLARIGHLIGPNDFPEVFAGLEPAPARPVPPATTPEVARALRTAGASTVRVEGAGCGGLSTGSGFIARPGLVVTNAHVIAGVGRPAVIDGRGRHAATTVVFDPDHDLAVLRVDGLAGPPLRFAGRPVARGTRAVVLGHPRGGPLRATPSGVGRRYEAVGRDIYGEATVRRAIYELRTRVVPGNSGGPVVLPDGRVIGVVFAGSSTNRDVGYAIAASEARSRSQRAADSGEVGSGRCVR